MEPVHYLMAGNKLSLCFFFVLKFFICVPLKGEIQFLVRFLLMKLINEFVNRKVCMNE